MFTGKGGAGKTSLAAATGVKLAALNYRTLVMSIDPAHSLADSFDLGTDLFHLQTSDPLQRMVIQQSMARNSSSFYHASAATAPRANSVTFSTPTP